MRHPPIAIRIHGNEFTDALSVRPLTGRKDTARFIKDVQCVVGIFIAGKIDDDFLHLPGQIRELEAGPITVKIGSYNLDTPVIGSGKDFIRFLPGKIKDTEIHHTARAARRTATMTLGAPLPVTSASMR